MFPESDDWETNGEGMYLHNKLYGEANTIGVNSPNKWVLSGVT